MFTLATYRDGMQCNVIYFGVFEKQMDHCQPYKWDEATNTDTDTDTDIETHNTHIKVQI